MVSTGWHSCDQDQRKVRNHVLLLWTCRKEPGGGAWAFLFCGNPIHKKDPKEIYVCLNVWFLLLCTFLDPSLNHLLKIPSTFVTIIYCMCCRKEADQKPGLKGLDTYTGFQF